MKYSIIVPAYNVAQYIEECVESVLNQNYDNYEVIVVDDGATDETPQIIDNLAQKSKKVRVIHQKNGGLSAARNSGIEAASGDYILFLDGDDFIAIETIPNMAEATALVELLADEFPDTEGYMSFTTQDSQKISDGTPMTEVAKLCDSSKQILAFGINCSRPAIISDLLKASRTISQKPLVTYPNSGEIYDGATQTWKSLPDNSHTLCENSQVWHKLGAKTIGGCCRTRPEDIKLLTDKLK